MHILLSAQRALEKIGILGIILCLPSTLIKSLPALSSHTQFTPALQSSPLSQKVRILLCHNFKSECWVKDKIHSPFLGIIIPEDIFSIIVYIRYYSVLLLYVQHSG